MQISSCEDVGGYLYPEVMIRFDPSQQQVFDLQTSRHARVLGAPGSGKTLLLVQSFAAIMSLPGWQEGDALVLASNRLVAGALRQRIERGLVRPMAGTPVRTAPSLAFAVLQAHAAHRGEVPLRLLTGTAHDEIVESVLAELLENRSGEVASFPFSPEVMLSEAFRAELRELARVLDDFALSPTELLARLRGKGSAASQQGSRVASYPVPGASTGALWDAGLQLLTRVERSLAAIRPGQLPASAMMRHACAAVRADESVAVPRLVLVDDAAELGEGALALLAAFAARGTRIWAFGDPDTATGAFQGERARVLAGLTAELRRRGAAPADGGEEQLVVLERVYRHGPEIRGLVTSLTDRVGVAGAGAQRKAGTQEQEPVAGAVRFATVSTPAEQVGVVAHRFRAARLGLGGRTPQPWSQMAVLCRSRPDAKRIARLLAAQQVPTSLAAGGVVLREHQLVRELIRLLQHALGVAPLGAREVVELLGGVVGGLDPISLRRLRGALRVQEVRAAGNEGRTPQQADALLLEAFNFPAEQPLLDMRGARQLNRLGKLAAAGQAAHRNGGTPREVLWQLWEGTGLALALQSQALDAKGARADEAHRSLDAVVALFFSLQRHEEQDSGVPIEQVLEDLLLSAVPEDSLAARSERDVVTVTTPQGAIGREFDLVCVLGVQEGAWPNLRSRGSLLGVSSLERWLRGDEAAAPSRRDTMHDELRLFVHAVARAREEVLVLAVASEDQHPSPFFSLGRDYRTGEKLPSSRLTLRGVTAEMRRRLVQNSADAEALSSLIALTEAGAIGAHPDEWYGVAAPSTRAPLADIDHDPEATVQVSPSQMERAETCPLDWVVSRLGGGASDYRAGIGVLLHRALELSEPGVNSEELFAQVVEQWGSLHFEANWQSERALAETQAMAEGLAAYLARFDRSGDTLLANEGKFEMPIGFARLRGAADRIEAHEAGGGENENEVTPAFEVTVVDLKTGRRPPSAKELEQHAQLQAYQLGVLRGAFTDSAGQPIVGAAGTGARLVYVHPDALGKTRQARGERYLEITQAGLDETAQQVFEHRVLDVARVMAGASFTAELEHHCTSTHTPGRACALHIIPAVSHGGGVADPAREPHASSGNEGEQ